MAREKPVWGRATWRGTVKAVPLLAGLAALSAFAASMTFALFSAARSSAANSITAGAVALVGDAGSDCAITSLLPDANPQTCTFTIRYVGDVPAYLALDVLIQTQAGVGGTKLYNPADGAHDLTVEVASKAPATEYTVPGTADRVSCPTGAPTGSTCYSLRDELVSAGPLTGGATVVFTTTFSLPTASTTGYRGGTAQIGLTAHAVQSANNPRLHGCTVGRPCPGTWS